MDWRVGGALKVAGWQNHGGLLRHAGSSVDAGFELGVGADLSAGVRTGAFSRLVAAVEEAWWPAIGLTELTTTLGLAFGPVAP